MPHCSIYISGMPAPIGRDRRHTEKSARCRIDSIRSALEAAGNESRYKLSIQKKKLKWICVEKRGSRRLILLKSIPVAKAHTGTHSESVEHGLYLSWRKKLEIIAFSKLSSGPILRLSRTNGLKPSTNQLRRVVVYQMENLEQSILLIRHRGFSLFRMKREE